jgi:hypothetical protein
MIVTDNNLQDLRARVARLHQEIVGITEAYRRATSVHDSQQAIPLLRSRSQLMRELLESQCQLLLVMRSETTPDWAGMRSQNGE